MFVHIGSVLCPRVRRPCFGDVLRVLSRIWEILIVQEHHTTICWRDGKLLLFFLWLGLSLLMNVVAPSSPTLVANLWDVTDKDIDKFSQSVFDKLSLNSMKEERSGSNKISIVAAVAQSRDSCKLKYLTGAAPVVYGIPFYL